MTARLYPVPPPPMATVKILLTTTFLTTTFLTTTLLTGCQQTLPKALNSLECSQSNQQLAALIELEHRYNAADSKTQHKMRRLAIAANNHQHSALLYSAAHATPGMLQQAVKHYNEATRRSSTCIQDHYLRLRQQQTQVRLQQPAHQAEKLQQALARLQHENQQLQQKIDALTGLETELSDQRSLPR
ncbi:MAG: hypothetical protein OIF57_18075 [Marinobacterium sp.]|nr:hypothetical protein [Marinobacterium sp.]